MLFLWRHCLVYGWCATSASMWIFIFISGRKQSLNVSLHWDKHAIFLSFLKVLFCSSFNIPGQLESHFFKCHQIYNPLLYFFLKLIYFYWRIVALQNFAVFCETSTWISHRYTYIPSLLKLPLYWRIYLQGNNGETDIENTLMDMGRGEEKVRCMERITWKLTFAVWLRKLKQTHFCLVFFSLVLIFLPDYCALLDWPFSTIVVGKSTG